MTKCKITLLRNGHITDGIVLHMIMLRRVTDVIVKYS